MERRAGPRRVEVAEDDPLPDGRGPSGIHEGDEAGLRRRERRRVVRRVPRLLRRPVAEVLEEARLVSRMLERKINSPLSCGMGRLFDAVSSLAGICDRVTFEGEAAIALEMAAADTDELYPYYLEGSSPMVINVMPLVRAIVLDIRVGVSASTVAGKFHNTIAAMVVEICALARDNTGLETVALSGGVFQNALLFGRVESGLQRRGFRVISHSKVPTNDACISLGQAVVASAKASEKSL